MYLLARATLRILNAHGITVGAGFVLENQLAVTCAHVIEDVGSGPGQPVQVAFYGKTVQQTATVHELGWAETEGDDLAFLKLESLPPSVEPVRLSTSQACGGHDFISLGFPDWKAPDVHWPQGKLAGWVPMDASRQALLQFQGTDIVEGCSGGALLDLVTLKVVGMVSRLRLMTETPNIGYATPSETLKKYWPALAVDEAQPARHIRVELGKHSRMTEGLAHGATVEWNPSFQVTPTASFQAHPAVEVPELRHLIGHRGELTELLEAYWRTKEGGPGAIFFLTGAYGYGTKALGRAFVDVLPQARCQTAITRFWPEDLQEKTLQDPRWRGLLAEGMQEIKLGPEFIRQEPLIPLWPILAQLAGAVHPMNYPHDMEALKGLFRHLAGTAPLILLLEDLEHAHFSWLDLIRYLAPEMQKGLPLIFILTLHTEKNLGLYRENELLPSYRLALDLTQRGQADIFPLGRVTEDDIAAYLSLEAPGMAQKLHQLTGGIPLLVESMWQEFLHKRQVKRTGPNSVTWQPDAEWNAWGSGRDYIDKILDELYTLEERPPWPKATMLEMLALAAQEGVMFTPVALAKTFEVSCEALLDALTDLTDGPDEEGVDLPGLVREIQPEELLQNTERYRFQPLVVWHALKEYTTPAPEKLLTLAESLREVYGPYVGRVAARLVHLYTLAEHAEKATEYLPILQSRDPFSSLVTEANLLLIFENSAYTDSRLLLVITRLGNMQYHSANPEHARFLFEKMVEAAKRLGNKEYQGMGTIRLGDISHSEGNYKNARQLYQSAFEIFEQIGSKPGMASCLHGLGKVTYSQEDYQAAWKYFQDAVEIDRQMGIKHGQAQGLVGLGQLASLFGDYVAGRNFFEKALALFEQTNQKAGVALALHGLGMVVKAQDDYQTAKQFYLRSLEVSEQIGNKKSKAGALIGLGEVALADGKTIEAQQFYLKALEIHEQLQNKKDSGICLKELANIAYKQIDFDLASRYYLAALARFESIGNKMWSALCLAGLGNIARDKAEYNDAEGYYQRALNIFKKIEPNGAGVGSAACLTGMANIASAQGNHSAAQEYSNLAQAINLKSEYKVVGIEGKEFITQLKQ